MRQKHGANFFYKMPHKPEIFTSHSTIGDIVYYIPNVSSVQCITTHLAMRYGLCISATAKISPCQTIYPWQWKPEYFKMKITVTWVT